MEPGKDRRLVVSRYHAGMSLDDARSLGVYRRVYDEVRRRAEHHGRILSDRTYDMGVYGFEVRMVAEAPR